MTPALIAAAIVLAILTYRPGERRGQHHGHRHDIDGARACGRREGVQNE